MQTLFLVEYQAKNDGTCTATDPLGYTDETAVLSAFYNKCASAVVSSCDTHTVMIVDREGNVWRGYKQVLRHGHEASEE